MRNVNLSVTEAEERRVREFLASLRTPCTARIATDSPFADRRFESEFRTKLLTHHCFMGSPLFQESFDSAFLSACVQAGFKVEEAPSGKRFWDASVDGRRLSLKSSKAQGLKKERLHISKLTEAAWIQDCRTARSRRDKTLELFEGYCSQVDAVIQLRYFAETKLYELVEVPVPMFAQVQTVGLSSFDSSGPTINIPIGKRPPDFTLKLDRSDSKITLANINKGLCQVIGTWQL